MSRARPTRAPLAREVGKRYSLRCAFLPPNTALNTERLVGEHTSDEGRRAVCLRSLAATSANELIFQSVHEPLSRQHQPVRLLRVTRCCAVPHRMPLDFERNRSAPRTPVYTYVRKYTAKKPGVLVPSLSFFSAASRHRNMPRNQMYLSASASRRTKTQSSPILRVRCHTVNRSYYTPVTLTEAAPLPPLPDEPCLGIPYIHRDAKVSGYSTTAMHDLSTPSAPLRHTLPL